jgi:phosphohistidine phosphatase
MREKENLLLIMRHAKSDRLNSFTNDFERPLNERGQYQLLAIAQQLNKLNIKIDKAIVSPAQRTRETWTLLQSHLITLPAKSVFEPRLYNTLCEDFIQVLIEHADQCRSLLVIAHCPTVIEVTEFLTGEYHDFKTANLAVLSAQKKEWSKNLSHPQQFRFKEMLMPEE